MFVPRVANAYAYDANGSLTGRTASARYVQDPATGALDNTSETDVYAYDVRNRLVTFTSDVSRSHTQYGPSGPADVPDSATHATVTYGYDDAGDRTSESTSTTVTPAGGSPTTTGKTTYRLIDGNNPTDYSQVVEEKGSPSGAPVISYVVGQEVLSQSDGTSVLYLLPDGHGSTRLVTDAAGSILANGRLDYDAWGNAVGFDAGTAPTRILYTGQRYDAAAGLYDLRARMYGPATGRFLALDPAPSRLSTPLTLHRYIYAACDPSNFVDPSGRSFGVDVLFAAAIDAYQQVTLAGVQAYARFKILETVKQVLVVTGAVLQGFQNELYGPPSLSVSTAFFIGFTGGFIQSYLALDNPGLGAAIGTTLIDAANLTFSKEPFSWSAFGKVAIDILGTTALAAFLGAVIPSEVGELEHLLIGLDSNLIKGAAQGLAEFFARIRVFN